jgi:excisionase family DNA binding protein
MLMGRTGYHSQIRLAAMTLTSAAPVLARYGYRLREVFQLIRQERVRCYWEDREAGGELYLAIWDLEAGLENVGDDRPFLSDFQVGRPWRVSAMTVADWAKHGVIQAQREPGVGWQVTRQEAERFLADYILPYEAAQLLGVPPDAVYRWVKQGRLHPVPGLQRYLLKRKEVEGLRQRVEG